MEIAIDLMVLFSIQTKQIEMVLELGTYYYYYIIVHIYCAVYFVISHAPHISYMRIFLHYGVGFECWLMENA